MIYFKVIAIVLTTGAGLLQIGLEHRWHDKRTNKYKTVRSILIGVMSIGFILTPIVVAYDDIQSANQVQDISDSKDAAVKAKETAEEAAKAAEERELKAIKARKQIKDELEQLQERIQPVIALATAKYPSLDTNSALLNLATDVQKLQEENEELKKEAENLKKKTKELSEQDYFHPLNASIRNRLVAGLRKMLADREGGLQISVVCETGNPMRMKVAKQLVEILSESGIEATGPAPTMTFSKGGLPAARLNLNPGDKDFVIQLAQALHDYMNVSYEARSSSQNETGKITIAIYGNPLFSEDGVVTFP